MRTYKKGTVTKMSNSFKSTEMDCHGNSCCSYTKVDEKLVTYLQKIRDHFGKPVTITSGYRCTSHNKAVGGASASYHTKGMAADISVQGIAPSEVAKYAESIGILGIGLYESAKDGYFVHIDTRTIKAFWYGQAQAHRSTFGGVAATSPKTSSAVKSWQLAAIADGFKFPSGADGIWGSECEAVAKKAICKKRLIGYKYRNLTKIVQRTVGVTADGKFGEDTRTAVKAFQAKKSLTADGEVGLNTWKKILNVK